MTRFIGDRKTNAHGALADHLAHKQHFIIYNTIVFPRVYDEVLLRMIRIDDRRYRDKSVANWLSIAVDFVLLRALCRLEKAHRQINTFN